MPEPLSVTLDWLSRLRANALKPDVDNGELAGQCDHAIHTIRTLTAERDEARATARTIGGAWTDLMLQRKALQDHLAALAPALRTLRETLAVHDQYAGMRNRGIALNVIEAARALLAALPPEETDA